MSCSRAALDGWAWALCEFCDSEPLVCVLFLTLEQKSAAQYFTAAVLSYVVVPCLAAVWLLVCLWKSSFFYFGLLRSDILKTTKAIITDGQNLWDKAGCHGDINGWIKGWIKSWPNRRNYHDDTHNYWCGTSFRVRDNRPTKAWVNEQTGIQCYDVNNIKKML